MNWGGKRENAGRKPGLKNNYIGNSTALAEELLSVMEDKGYSLAEAYIQLAFTDDNSMIRLKALNEITNRMFGKIPDTVLHNFQQSVTAADLFSRGNTNDSRDSNAISDDSTYIDVFDEGNND